MADEREPTLTPGTLFQGGYEILAPLGSGAFGWVHRARQLSTGQDVAIKILRTRPGDLAAGRENQVARFRREMRLCAELSHPNIVRLIDSGEAEGGLLFAVFEYVPGATLKEVLAEEGKLGAPEAIHLMTQVLDALSCAHLRGVVHRDLKPDNIMVTKTGVRRNALVLDFGLGGFTREAENASMPRLTATHEIMGTPCYAAPEQLRGEAPTTRSDLYSWGLILLECVTGETAVHGASGQEVIMRQLGPEPVPIPASLRKQPLGRLLQVVTAKQVERRDVTIEGLFESLGAIEREGLTGTAAGVRERALPDGTRRQLTVVSARLGVEPLEARVLDLEEVDELLHAQHALVAEVAARHGGRVASALADRVVLAFGHPRAQEDDARRAARAALAVAAETERASRRLEAERRVRLKAYLGIHSGLVIVRELRQGIDHGLYDLIGPTPQIAARLDEQAGPGEVLASSDTKRLLRDAVEAESAGELRFAEHSRPLPVFRLSQRVDRPVLETVAQGAETPLVGRGSELGQLLGSWERARAGRAGAVLISGEAGIGKSRLVRELQRRVPADAWLEARCMIEHQESPLRPFVDLLLALGQPLDALLARHGFDLGETMPLFVTLLPEQVGNAYPPLPLTPDRLRELTLATLLSLFLKMAQERPVVLVLEDLHWADPTMIELVGQMVQELRTAQVVATEPAARLCLVLTARPEFSPPWPLEDLTRIHPSRLGREDVEQMLAAQLVDGAALPRGLLEQVVRHADGVPLFVEEVIRMLVESGALREVDELASDGPALEIPVGLRELLTARLDLLSSSARATVELAAVLGREFRYELLGAVARKDESLLREDVRELMDSGLLHARRSARAESYVFKHALIRDAAYESMMRRTRRDLHARIARTLCERFPDIEQNRPDILAQHFERGEDFQSAADYWKRAGDRTMAGGAYVESIRLFERGLGLLERLPPSRERMLREVALSESLGTALLVTQGWTAPKVEETFARALALCEELGGDVPLRVLAGVWFSRAVRSDRDATYRLWTVVQRRAEGSDDGLLRLTAHAYTGVIAFYGGDFSQARDESKKATEWYHSEDYQAFVREYGYDGGIDNFAFLMWSLGFLGYADQALEVSYEMLAIAERTRNPYAMASALGFSANLARDRGDLDRVFELTQRTMAFASEQKLYFWLGPAMCTQGWALAQRGSPDEGIVLMRQGLGVYEALGVRGTYAYHLSGLVEAQLAQGAAAEALPLVRDALGQCAVLLDCFYEPELRRLEGELLRAQGSHGAAEASFHAALALAERRNAKALELRAATSLARLLQARGERDQAREVLGDVYRWFTQGLGTRDLRVARALLAELA
jgi:TOMM system kinase/cyclase fusion protein